MSDNEGGEGGGSKGVNKNQGRAGESLAVASNARQDQHDKQHKNENAGNGENTPEASRWNLAAFATVLGYPLRLISHAFRALNEYANGVIAIFTIVLAWTSWLMWTNAQDTLEVIKAASKPSIFIESVTVEFDEYGKPVFSAAIRNTGTGDAHSVWNSYAYEFYAVAAGGDDPPVIIEGKRHGEPLGERRPDWLRQAQTGVTVPGREAETLTIQAVNIDDEIRALIAGGLPGDSLTLHADVTVRTYYWDAYGEQIVQDSAWTGFLAGAPPYALRRGMLRLEPEQIERRYRD